MERVRFGRVMDGGNQPPPAYPLWVLYGFQPVSETLSAGIKLPDAIFQASATHLHEGDGEHWKHGVFFSEHTNSVPV